MFTHGQARARLWEPGQWARLWVWVWVWYSLATYEHGDERARVVAVWPRQPAHLGLGLVFVLVLVLGLDLGLGLGLGLEG